MANKLRVNLMQCGARQASRVIYPEGILLDWGDGLWKALEKINGSKKHKKGADEQRKTKIVRERMDKEFGG